MAEKRKCALITGASGGLGYEFAKIFAKKDHDLVLVARNEEKLNSVKSELEENYGINVYVFACDLTQKSGAKSVYDFTKEKSIFVDVLVNNAGFGDFGAFADCEWDKQYNMIELNIASLTQMTRLFMGEMIKRGEGKILNVSSVAAFCAGPKMSVYFATKAYVLSFSEAVAEELRGSGVTVTALCPPPTATGFETAAKIDKRSAMFKKTANPQSVAEAGVRALDRGKAICCCGALTKAANVFSKILPRSILRRFVAALSRNCKQ